MKESKLYVRWMLLSILRVVVTVAPLCIAFIVKREEYFSTVAQTVKLSIGGVICVVLLFVATVGKVPMPSRLVLAFTSLAISWLLGAVIKDLTLLLFMWVIGEVLDLIVAPWANRAQEMLSAIRTGTVVASVVSEEIKKGGRV